MRIALTLVFIASVAHADTIKLANGGTLEGIVLKETDASYVVKLKYGTTTLAKSDVLEIVKTEVEPSKAAAGRLTGWEKCVETIIAKSWSADFRPIPATVIDKGILQNVPYLSHRCGNYEFNIYGDPDAPACLEIGIHNELLKSDDAKKECLAVMLAVLGDAKDVELLKTLNMKQDKKEREGLTFEFTPETAEDAYGGWWISIYDVKKLDASRATEKELAEITVSQEDIEKDEDEAPKKVEEAKKNPPPPPPKASGSKVHSTPDPYGHYRWYRWTKKDATWARKYNRVQSTPKIARYYTRSYHRPTGGYQRPAGCPHR